MGTSFDAVAAAVPVKPVHIELQMEANQRPDGTREYVGAFMFRIRGSDGSVLEERRGDLTSQLPAGLQAKAKDLLDFALDKARGTVG